MRRVVPKVVPAVSPEEDELPVVAPSPAWLEKLRAVPLVWWAAVAGGLLGLILVGILFTFWRAGGGQLVSPLDPKTTQPTPTPEPAEPSFTVAVVGYGGAGHDGASLTDSIVVARFLLEQKRVVMLSVPRDLWVSAPTESGQTQAMKINAVYALHGPEALKAALSQVTGWPVDRFFGVDFRGFTQAIDTLGGVELIVERAFDDYEYPIPGRENMICEEELNDEGEVIATPDPQPEDDIISVADEIEDQEVERDSLPKNVKDYPCRYEHLHFEAGRQTLTGEQALKYARSRHAPQDGNDFNRARRQQNLIQSLRDQVFRVNFISKIPGLISTLRANTATDLGTLEIAEWLAKAQEVRDWPVTNVILTDQNYLEHGQSADRQFILQTQADNHSFAHVHNWLAWISNSNKALTAPVIEIQAGPNFQTVAHDLQAQIASSSAIPTKIVSVAHPRSASASAVIQPLVPGIEANLLNQLQQLTAGTLDSSLISTQSAAWSGPHLRILWK